jgi:hypothetical protein
MYVLTEKDIATAAPNAHAAPTTSICSCAATAHATAAVPRFAI